jgi:hypothetical protein
LTQGINRPKRGWDPPDERELQDQTYNPGKRASDREEKQPGQENGEQETHGIQLPVAFISRHFDSLILSRQQFGNGILESRASQGDDCKKPSQGS